MPFLIRVRNDLSLANIVSLSNAGRCVMKTPHVGNWYANNLAIASLGIRMKVCDHTRGERDKNFHPHTVIRNGTQTIVGSSSLLMTHAAVEHAMDDVMIPGERIGEGHMRALQKAIPELNAEQLNAEFLPRNAERALRIVRYFAEHFPMLFERRVLSSGNTMQESLRSVQQLDRNGVYGVTSLAEGWLMPNALNILMDGAIDAATMGECEVFALSGPDMFRYIPDMQAQLHELYDGLRSVMPELPETMTYHVVRVAEMRFAVPERRRRTLDTLIDQYCRYESIRGSWNMQLRDARAQEKAEMILAANTERAAATQQLRNAIGECSEPFYAIAEGTYLSQYDLLSRDERIVIHPWAMETSLADVETAVRVMMKLRG